MRDLLLLSIFSPLTLLSLVHPWGGLLTFGWIAFVKPHTMIWSFASEMSFNLVIAVTTAIGWAVSREKKSFKLDLTAALLIALTLSVALSTTFSLVPEASKFEFSRFMKTMAFLLLLRIMLTSRVRVHGYIWLMAFAMGYLGLNGGTLFIITAGAHHLAGPPLSEIADRNHLALAMLVGIPLMNYLRLQSRHRWMQIGLMGAMVMTVMAVLATYSRGGFIGLIAMGAFLWWRSKSRILALAALLVVAVGLHSVVPDHWKERMGTIETATSDDNSFKLRLLSWHAYASAALDRPLTGVGLYALQSGPVFFRYAPDPVEFGIVNDRPRAAHSIYLQVLGDLGLAGFAVYLALLATGFWNARWLARETRGRPELEWMADLGRMIQVSMVAFCVAGAALSMAFYDYFLSLLVVAAAVRQMAEAKLGWKASKRIARSRHSQPLVETTTIAHIWQKAADKKVSRLRGRITARGLASEERGAK
jgi:probable O-glycosylation ligase (exosortase A-associated)